MIKKQEASQQGTHSQQQKYPNHVVTAAQSHPTRSPTSSEDESDSELYGLALILRNTQDSAVTATRGNGLSEKTHNKEVRKEDTTRESLEKDHDKSHLRCFPTLNRRLIIYKSFYFFFFSAIGSLFPYLAVFYKQLWLSAQETGILIGIRPLIQLFGTPMWGVIADTYKKSRLIFIVSLIAWLVSNYSLSLVSPVFHLGNCKDNATIGMVHEIAEVMNNRTISVKNSTSPTLEKPTPRIVVNPGKASEHWFEIVGKVTESNSTRKPNHPRSTSQNQNLLRNTMNRSKDHNKIFRRSNGKLYSLYRLRKREQVDPLPVNLPQRLRRHIESSKIFVTVKTLLKSSNNQVKNGDKVASDIQLRRSKAISDDSVSESDLERIFHNSSMANIKELSSRVNKEQIERVFDSLNMAGEYPWPLDTVADYKLTQGSYDWQMPHDTHLFTILFVITATGTLIAAPAITLADTATLQILGDRPEDYGKQRLWGAFGWGLAAFIVGSSLSTLEEINNCNNPLSVDYLPCFYAFACLMGVALLIGALFEFDDKQSQEADIWQGLRTLIDCQYMYFILTILFCGIALGFIQTFLFWHLEDLGGSQYLFSTITAIHCISEVMVYSFSGFFIKHFGHHRVLYVGLSCYIIRFFGYALITNSWVVLPFELLHGLSTAAVWSAAVVFVGLIPGAPATMQGILGGVHWGLGNGGGGVVGGLLITYTSTTTSFLIFGVVSLIDLSLFVCLNNMEYFNCFQWSKEVGARSQYTLQEDKVDEDEEAEYDDLY